MKKTLLPITIALSSLFAADSFDGVLKDSKISLDTRVFYFDRSNANSNHTAAQALTAGGIAKVETGSYYGLQLGLAGYGSYLVGLTDRADGAGSSLLESGTNDNLSFVGESYIKYTYGKTSLQVGNQRLFTPLANDHDLRLLPATYQAAVVRSRELDDTLLEAGWIGRYSGFCSKFDKFNNMETTWGDKGLTYFYVENSSIKNSKIRAQYAKAVDDAKISSTGYTDYRYLDMKYSITKDSFVAGQYGGNDYKTTKDSHMYGATAGVNFDYIDTAIVYNKITDNNFKAIESGEMYTDWQQGYANYEPSEAVGGYIVLKPMQNLTVKLGRVNVIAKENSVKDGFSETLTDIWYKFDASNKLRIRYSFKDESNSANHLATPSLDRTDFRVVYYYSFAK